MNCRGQILAFLFLAAISALVDSASIQKVIKLNEDDKPVEITYSKISIEIRSSEVNPSSKIQLRKHKKYIPEEINLKALEEPSLGEGPEDASIWIAKMMNDEIPDEPVSKMEVLQGRNPFDGPSSDIMDLYTRARNRKGKLRVRRESPMTVEVSTEASAASAADDDDEEEEDDGGRARPTPTPQPSAIQYFVQTKTENGQSQAQSSGASDNDEMNYNNDGSVKSHNLVSSTSNKQENSQFQRSESVIPVSQALNVDSILGTGPDGQKKSLISSSQLSPLAPIAPLEPLKLAKNKKRKSKSLSRSVNDGDDSQD